MPASLETFAPFAPRPGLRFDVICIGNALMDHLAFAEPDVVVALGLAPGAMTLVDIATAQRIAAAAEFDRQVSGGTSANTAVGIASLGGRAAFVGAVARDELGRRYADDLNAAGVEAVLEWVSVSDDPELATGRCHVLVTPDAERTMATALGVSGRLDHTFVDAELLASTRALYFDSYSLDFPDADRLMTEIVDGARAAGTLLAVGLADPFAVERHRNALTQLLAGSVDLVFANEAEALALTGANDAEGAIAALRRPGIVAIVTRGALGAVIASKEQVIELPAMPVDQIVDLTGAGDLFAAGALFALARGEDLATAGRLGALCAAEVISHLGARPETSLAKLADDAGLLGANLTR